MSWIFWMPLGAVILHIIEEFVFPGGFANWDREFRPSIRSSITSRLHIVVNGLLTLLGVSVGIDGQTPIGVALWLALAALVASNAVFHVIGTVWTRRYSPGVVTGVCIYIPLAVWGYPHFLRSGSVSGATALVAALLGGSYHFWAAGLHALRTRHG